MEGAHGVLLSISGGSDLGLFEINEAASLVSDAAHADANIIFGAVIDDALGDEVRVTVIAAGFDSGRPSERKDGEATAMPGAVTGPGFSAGLSPHRRPVGAMTAHGTGERLATSAATPSARSGQGAPTTPPAGQQPAQQPAVAPASSASPRPAGSNGGGITVPPLPPIAGQGANRRPLSSEDFEEELDIPEFLKG